MTTDEVRTLLRRECEKAGSQKAWAIAHKVDGTYVGDTIRGRCDPGPAICKALGLRRVTTYERV